MQIKNLSNKIHAKNNFLKTKKRYKIYQNKNL